MASFNEHKFDSYSTSMQDHRVSRRFSSSSRELEQVIQRTFSRGCLANSTDVTFDQNDTTQLFLDQIAKHMLEFLSSINPSSDNSSIPICNNCDEDNQRQAVHWCDKCECYLCESCTTKIHSNKAFQSHTTISSTEKLLSFCSYHSKKMLKYWCKKCRILICDYCLEDNHKHHIYSSLKDAATKARTKFQETVQEVSQIRRNLTTFSETTKDLVHQQRELTRQAKLDIEQTFNYLHCLIEERQCAMIKQLDDNISQTAAILDRQTSIIQQLINLAIVNEDCIQRMLTSNDHIQVLKLESTLHQNYNDFVEIYNQTDDGYVIKRHLFRKDDKDMEQISNMITKLGHFNGTSWMVRGDSVTVQTISLDLSRIVGNIAFLMKENTCARGYKLILKKRLKLRSVQIHSDHVGSIIGFVVNDIGTIIQKNTAYSSNQTMRWLSVPIECDLQNNYSILILTTSDNGSFTYKNGDNQIRILNQNCSVESIYVHSLAQININSKVNVENHPFSLDMVLCIQE